MKEPSQQKLVLRAMEAQLGWLFSTPRQDLLLSDGPRIKGGWRVPRLADVFFYENIQETDLSPLSITEMEWTLGNHGKERQQAKFSCCPAPREQGHVLPPHS